LDNYARDLGKVIGNFHSLELTLRVFLHNVDWDKYGSPPPEVSLAKSKAGDVIPENYLTNWDSLRDLMKKYNDLVASCGSPELCGDETTVKLRDAFAHGRVLGVQAESPFRLYKFRKPTRQHRVTVERITNLSKEVLSTNECSLLLKISILMIIVILC